MSRPLNSLAETHPELAAEADGWDPRLVSYSGPMNGDLARQWETDILRMLRSKNAIVGRNEIAGRFTGYTESWMKNSYPVKSLSDIIEAVRESDFEKK